MRLSVDAAVPIWWRNSTSALLPTSNDSQPMMPRSAAWSIVSCARGAVGTERLKVMPLRSDTTPRSTGSVFGGTTRCARASCGSAKLSTPRPASTIRLQAP